MEQLPIHSAICSTTIGISVVDFVASVLSSLRVSLTLVVFAVTTSINAQPELALDEVDEMIVLPSGMLQMGSLQGAADEQPIVEVRVDAFAIDKSPVTVAQFAQFVASTDYQTNAEIFGDSAVFDMAAGQWALVKGAYWQKPFGAAGSAAQADHPVTHVSWFDAKTYCEARDKALLTEAQWEYAARGGNNRSPTYAFGDRLIREGEFLANVFTGNFPRQNDAADGYLYTSPVGVFGRTPLGLTDMAGNVWEWTEDIYAPYHSPAQAPNALKPRAMSGAGGEPTAFGKASTNIVERVQKGGSFLCAKSVCHGYRTSARGHSTPESSHIHVGFRCGLSI